MGIKLTFAPLGSFAINANPGAPVQQGLPIKRAGWVFKPGKFYEHGDSRNVPGTYEAEKEPFSCDSESPLGRACLKVMSRRDSKRAPPAPNGRGGSPEREGSRAPLACIDEQTAAACGPPHYVRKPEWKDGVWVMPVAPASAPRGKGSTAGGKA